MVTSSGLCFSKACWICYKTLGEAMCDNHPCEYCEMFLFIKDSSYLTSYEGIGSVDTTWMIEFFWKHVAMHNDLLNCSQ